MSSSSSVFLDTFTQHVLRSSLQINIWMTAHVAKPPMKSAVLFGWEDRNGLVPVFISVTVCKGGQISKVFWTVFKYFKNGSFANPEQG
jgi:hypothetical protein